MIEPTIVSALSALFGGRVYPDTAPAGAQHPFCIYQQVGGVPSNALCGDTDARNARIQLVAWTTTRPQASTLMRQAAAILTAAPIRAVSQGELIARYDEATRTYGAMQDFSFWWR